MRRCCVPQKCTGECIPSTYEAWHKDFPHNHANKITDPLIKDYLKSVADDELPSPPVRRTCTPRVWPWHRVSPPPQCGGGGWLAAWCARIVPSNGRRSAGTS